MPSVQRASLCDQLIDMMIAEIKDGKWEPGSKLIGEIELSESYQVSRNIMREALKILENFGVLDAKNGVGTFVSKQALENIQNMEFFYRLKDNTSVEAILEMRLMCEPTAAYLAATRIDETGIEELQKLSKSLMKKYKSHPEYQDDFELHLAIAHYSGNVLWEDLCRSLINQLQNSLYAEFNKFASHKTRSENLTTHSAIIQAIVEHRAELAQQLMWDHLHSRLLLINPEFDS